jgi:hypothetical protein
MNWTKEKQNKQKMNNKLAMNKTNTDPLIMTVQYLQGLNIFAIMELWIATLFAWMLFIRN